MPDELGALGRARPGRRGQPPAVARRPRAACAPKTSWRPAAARDPDDEPAPDREPEPEERPAPVLVEDSDTGELDPDGRPVRPVPAVDPEAGTQPAGRVLVVMVAALLLAMLVNADVLVERAERKPLGPERDRELAVWHPVQDVSHALQLYRVRQLADWLAGNDDDHRGGSPVPQATPETEAGREQASRTAGEAGATPSRRPPPKRPGPPSCAHPPPPNRCGCGWAATRWPRSSAGRWCPRPRPPA